MLVLAEILLPEWAGPEAPRPSRPIEATFRFDVTGSASDYDRAVEAAAGKLGILSVGNGQSLVLGNEPHATTWIPEDGGPGGWLVRWEYANSDADAERALLKGFEIAKWIRGPTFRTVPGPHLLFDAGFAGREVGMSESLRLSLPAPQYQVSTGFLRPNDQTSLIVHRLQG